MSSTSATIASTITALSRRPRLTVAVKRAPVRACTEDSANRVNLRRKIDGRHYRAWYHVARLNHREPHDDYPAQPPHHSRLGPRGLQRGGVRGACQPRAAPDHRA